MITYECKKKWRATELNWVFDNWIANTALLCDQMERRTFKWYDEPFRPFHGIENSGVSILLAGAAKAGFLPVSEYSIEKNSTDGVINGRADLWFIYSDNAYSYEFKRAWNTSTPKKLKKMMDLADDDINKIPEDEYNFAFSGLIAPHFAEYTEKEILDDFIKEVDCCYTIGDEKNYKAYIYFNRRVGS